MVATLAGGAFGRRVDNDAAGAAAWLALQLKRPVQVLQFVGDDIPHGQVRTIAAQWLEATLDAQGRIQDCIALSPSAPDISSDCLSHASSVLTSCSTPLKACVT